MLALRPSTEDDLRNLTGWEAEPDTALWLGETGAAWHARALAAAAACSKPPSHGPISTGARRESGWM
jgi:hypothetical protein